MASKNGRPSMSPVVPPISVMTTSLLDRSASRLDAVLNLVGDMRNDLDSLAQIIAAPFLVQNGLIDLAAGQVVHAGELDVGEALVMAQIQIGFRAVIQHVNLAVLIGVHGAGIDVEVGVEFLQRDLKPAVLQQGAQGGGGQALAQRTDHAARDKNVFHDGFSAALFKTCSTRLRSAGTSTPTLS